MIGGDAETLSALEVGVLCNNASLGLDGREAEKPDRSGPGSFSN